MVLRVCLIRAQDLPKSNVLSTTDLSQYATFTVKNRKSQESIENNVNQEWNEELVFHVNLMTQDMTW